MGIVGTLLSACLGRRPRSDASAVQSALVDAVGQMPEHIDGALRFQDAMNAGTRISGNLTLAGGDRAGVEASLSSVLETVIRTYREQADVRTASVLLEAHPEGDAATRVMASDVVPPGDGTRVTTDDLAAHFGL